MSNGTCLSCVVSLTFVTRLCPLVKRTPKDLQPAPFSCQSQWSSSWMLQFPWLWKQAAVQGPAATTGVFLHFQLYRRWKRGWDFLLIAAEQKLESCQSNWFSCLCTNQSMFRKPLRGLGLNLVYLISTTRIVVYVTLHLSDKIWVWAKQS